MAVVLPYIRQSRRVLFAVSDPMPCVDQSRVQVGCLAIMPKPALKVLAEFGIETVQQPGQFADLEAARDPVGATLQETHEFRILDVGASCPDLFADNALQFGTDQNQQRLGQKRTNRCVFKPM